MVTDKHIKETVKVFAKQFEAKNNGRFDLLSNEVKIAMFVDFCMSPMLIRNWAPLGEEFVQLHIAIRNHYAA